jgi:hypothetical protein
MVFVFVFHGIRISNSDGLVKSQKTPISVIPSKVGATSLETFCDTINFDYEQMLK